MQASNQIKNFTCQLHPSEVIQRVCPDSDDGSSLKCIECILNDTEKTPKDSMMALDEFIDHATKHYKTFRRIITAFENTPPKELIDFLAQEDENIQKLSQHIEQEKQRANNAFDMMVQEFTQVCHRKKNQIANQLDQHIVTLRFNYSYYKSKLDRYYNREDELTPDKEALINRINQCQDTNQVEVLIRNIKDDLLEASSPDSLEQKINQINESFNYLAQTLQNQTKSLPKTKFSDQASIESSLGEFREAADSLMEDFVEIDNKIFELSFTNFLSFDSKLIKEQEDLNLLNKWLALSHKDFKLRLLYRGSRDGMNWEAFHKRCDNHDTTLTIAKSHHGKVFGGYTDRPWNSNDNFTASQKSWLFSIDEKLQFPIMETGYPYAIYSTANYGPTFGSGHDLYIALPLKENIVYSNGSYQSSSNLGSSYRMHHNPKTTKKKGKKNSKTDQSQNQTILAGSFQFNIEELEIYAVEDKTTFESNSRDPEIYSDIINPEQDLDLIKSWLDRGENPEIELIYRASRDGFRAEDFHRNCDEKGPTLIICKSKFTEKVFGGFTSKNWTKDEVFVEDQEAFLFSLTHRTKHPILQKENAIFCSGNFGPIFGFGYDLFICTESNAIPGSTSALGVSYQASDSIENLNIYLAGNEDFYVDEIEVFTVKTS